MNRSPRAWVSSYRSRLVLGFVVVIALLAASWAVSLYGPLTSAITDQQEAHLASVAKTGALALEGGPASPAGFATRLASETGLRVTIVATSGVVLADSEAATATMENHLTRPEIAAALRGRVGTNIRKSKTQGTDQMYIAVAAALQGRPLALRVSEPLASVDALAARARTTGLLLLLAASLVSMLFVARLTAGATAPVTRLAAAARAIARGDVREVPRETGELGVVSDALDELADQVRTKVSELEGEQANLRAVLDGLPDAVLLLDGGRVRFANGAAAVMFREPPAGWRNAALASLDLPESLLAFVKAGLGSEDALAGEIATGPGQLVYRVAVTPLNGTPAFHRTLVLISDITERSRLDEVRRDFVANASHELKTPTSAVQLLAESAAAAAADGDTGRALSFLGQIGTEAGKLRRLVADLLDLSRLESVAATGTVTDVREAISLAVTGHHAAAKSKELELRVEDEPIAGQDVYAAADPTDLAVALDNLLANAVAYTEAGGVTIRVTADPDTVNIAIIDTGVGIPSADLPRVFERFYRVDRARSRDSGGTGLGLALVRHVVERSGGLVDIASQPSVGTTVTVRLPRAI